MKRVFLALVILILALLAGLVGSYYMMNSKSSTENPATGSETNENSRSDNPDIAEAAKSDSEIKTNTDTNKDSNSDEIVNIVPVATNNPFVKFNTGLEDPVNYINEVPQTIYNSINGFYIDVDNKNFESAYLQTSGYFNQTLTLEEFINLYENTDYISLLGMKIVNLENLEFELQVLLKENGTTTIYNVNTKLRKIDDSNYGFQTQNSVAISDSYFLDCKAYELADGRDLCFLRHQISNQTIYILGNAYATGAMRFTLNLGRSGDSETYFYSAFGDAGYMGIGVYSISTSGELNFVGYYSFQLNLYDSVTGTEYCQGEDRGLMSSYETGCLSNYKNETWYKENVAYLKARKTYLKELTNI